MADNRAARGTGRSLIVEYTRGMQAAQAQKETHPGVEAASSRSVQMKLDGQSL